MIKYLLMCIISFAFLACTHVAPYDKDVLGSQKMLTSPNPIQSAFEGHVFPIREGTSGATSGFAGGCGCK